MFDPIFSRILVAYDGSDPSKRALDLASKTAAMFKGELIILTVVSRGTFPIFAEGREGPMRTADIQEYLDKMQEFYRKALENAEADVSMRYPDLKFEALLIEGRPAATIVEEAERRDVNLIMLGSRGLGGITGWILGSTSREVANQCTKPILIVK
jgi:nucleotide-binding universal stress UspA family protein